MRSNDLNSVRISSWFFFFFLLAILGLSFFLVIVFDLQIGKNKTFLAENGNKIGVRLFLFVFVNSTLNRMGGWFSFSSLASKMLFNIWHFVKSQFILGL